MENYKDLFNAAKEEAILEFQHFLYLLDIEPDAFEHIYNAKMVIGKTTDGTLGFYNTDKNKITINRDYVKIGFEIIEKNVSKEKKVILSLAETFLHEMIHANRTIMLGNSMDFSNAFDLFQYEQTKNQLKKSGYDLDLYDNILAKTDEKPESLYYICNVPVKANVNEDGTFKVISYNRKTNNYDVYNSIPVETTPGIDVMFSIGMILNSKKVSYIPDHTIITPNMPEAIGEACCVSNCYISTKEVTEPINVIGEIAIFRNFEEVLTETITQIILKSRKDRKINLKQVTKQIASSDKYSLDVRVGAKFIGDLDIDFVKWFMLSTYGDCYYNYIENKFEDKTLQLATKFSCLYEFVKNAEDEADKCECIPYIKSINNIVKKNRN